MNYYNDNDPKACAWLRELIAAGELPAGDVDGRSILEVKADELAKYDQCHFFAGIGGWALALRWAGLEGVAGIWTGSCPCQPFSCAGQGKGTADERHLWPALFRLICDCGPSVVFGEQVASADVIGKAGRRAQSQSATVWLDGVFGDLEGSDYACGAAVMGAFSVGAPHRRQRLYWVADAGHERVRRATGTGETARGRALAQGAGCGVAGELAAAKREQEHQEQQRPTADEGGRSTDVSGGRGAPCGLGDAASRGCGERRDAAQPGCGGHADGAVGAGAAAGLMGDAESAKQHGGRGEPEGAQRQERQQHGGAGAWGDYDTLPCRDGKARRVESQPQQMADGVSAHLDALRGAGLSEDEITAATECFPLTQHAVGRMMLLRGYGNAILPQLAEVFVRAWMECNGNGGWHE